MSKIGIYLIKNTRTEKVYIGQSKHCGKRWKNHLSDLRKNKHKNKYLQNAFNLYGEEYFIFSIIEECSIEELDEKEKYWIEMYNSTNISFGYNFEKGGRVNRSISDEHRAKLSVASKGNKYALGYKHTEEAKRRISEASKGNTHGSLCKRTDEYRKHLSLINKGKVLTEEHKQKIAQSHKGLKHSEETKEKISRILKGRKMYNG